MRRGDSRLTPCNTGGNWSRAQSSWTQAPSCYVLQYTEGPRKAQVEAASAHPLTLETEVEENSRGLDLSDSAL